MRPTDYSQALHYITCKQPFSVNAQLLSEKSSNINILTRLWTQRWRAERRVGPFSAETAIPTPRALPLCPNVREQHVPNVKTERWAVRPIPLTDCWWQPIGARNPPERDRKYAELPRSWFICGQAETFGRHFVAALLSGVSQVVQRRTGSGEKKKKLGCANAPPAAWWKRSSTRLTTGTARCSTLQKGLVAPNAV